MAQVSLMGGCLCGSIRYAAAGDVTNLCYCHCDSCRRAVGAPMVPWGTVAREKFAITRGRLTEYRSSPSVTRGFCAGCGTSLTYRNDARANEIDITLATLDQPNALAPDAHIWLCDKLSWVNIADGLPQFTTVRPDAFDLDTVNRADP